MKQRPPGSNWGDYGSDDVLGRLNELTAERVRRAALEIRTGERFCLSLPLDYPGGTLLVRTRLPPVRQPVMVDGVPASDRPRSASRPGAKGVSNDDIVTLYTQYSTQWDAFGHRGGTFDADGDGQDEIVYYNGQYPAPGVEHMATAGLQGRGVMVDLHRRYGDEYVEVDFRMLDAVMREQGVTVEPGDMLCVHTGFGQLLMDWEKSPDPRRVKSACAVLDGSDAALHEWISKSGISCLIADNQGVELMADRQTHGEDSISLHELCLFKLGIPLGELWYLTELARWLREHDRYRFFLTAPPLRYPGAVGSPVTPIATV